MSENIELVERWRKATALLGVRMVAPFQLTLRSGAKIDADLMIEKIGGTRGIIITTEFSKVKDFGDELEEAGFGCSVLSAPRPDAPFILPAFINMMRDWTWCGPEEDEPSWMKGGGYDPSDDDD